MNPRSSKIQQINTPDQEEQQTGLFYPPRIKRAEEPETNRDKRLLSIEWNDQYSRTIQLRRRRSRRGLCFTSICIRDNDLVCERLCHFMFDDSEASSEIRRQEEEWRRDKELKQEQINRKVEETVRAAKEYFWKELYTLVGKFMKWISGS